MPSGSAWWVSPDSRMLANCQGVSIGKYGITNNTTYGLRRQIAQVRDYAIAEYEEGGPELRQRHLRSQRNTGTIHMRTKVREMEAEA